MIDSTNPRIMANNIRELESKIGANDVEGNPSGTGYNTLLTKMKIDGKKYKLPNQVIANPMAEATDEVTKLEIGGAIYSLGGGYTPNYSETEAEVGSSFDSKPVYGKLIVITGAIPTTITKITDAAYIDKIVYAKAIFVADDDANCCYDVSVFVNNDGELKYRGYMNENIKSGHLYIEYTKVASE